MVQGINAAQNPQVSINKIGTTPEGRTIYEIKDAKGNGGKLTINSVDCDTFEKSYNDFLEYGPKLEEYLKNTPPEKIKKKQKLAKWIVGLGVAIGGGIPALKIKSNWYIQLPAIVGGALVGLLTGTFIARKTTTPPGGEEIAKASSNLSKIDIQPYLA